jgi:hypothetical protein
MARYRLSVTFEVDPEKLTPVKDAEGCITGFLDKCGDTVRLVPAIGLFWRDGKTGGYIPEEKDLKDVGITLLTGPGLIY